MGLKFWLALFLTIGSASAVEAVMDPRTLPAVNESVASAYNSTTTVAVTASSASAVISSYPVIVHSVVVNTTGTASNLELWNSNVSTFAAGAERFLKWPTVEHRSAIYDAFLSSGLALNNYGTIPAEVTVTYRQR